jgi:NAD(P)H-flavin reductase
VLPIAKALFEAGNKVISIIGARTKEMLILEDEMRKVSTELYVTTDDGTYGHHGFVTDVLKQIIEKGEKIEEVVGIGPVIMMKAVSDVTRPHNIRTIVSLNTIMVDGTGMCGCCRATIGNETNLSASTGLSLTAIRLISRNLWPARKCITVKRGEPSGIISASLNFRRNS